MLNSGEGGFLMTNDDEIAAKAMCYAGSYEKLYVKHSSCPPHEVLPASATHYMLTHLGIQTPLSMVVLLFGCRGGCVYVAGDYAVFCFA